MIKLASMGLWSSIVALAAAYFGAQWSLGSGTPGGKAAVEVHKTTLVRVKPISVPISADGRISGYVVAQFNYTARADTLKKLEIKPEIFLYDAIVSAIFTREKLDYTALSKNSWKEFSTHVKEAVNTRLGTPVVEEIITEEFGFVPF